MFLQYFASRFRLIALISAFLAGVGVTIFSWWVGLILLVAAVGLDFLSFVMARREQFSQSFGDLLSIFSQR